MKNKTTEVKERPILFTGPMVRALLAGKKTQTRRFIKVQPPADGYRLTTLMSTTGSRKDIGKHEWAKMSADGFSIEHSQGIYFKSPYGYKGDRLWVKETWNTDGDYMDYRADYNDGNPTSLQDLAAMPPDWKSSLFMPRWASRILLEVVSVRVERLQNISEADAIAEGLKICHNMNGREGNTGYVFPDCDYDKSGLCHSMPETAYSQGWDAINGSKEGRTWFDNPWVWVVEFKAVQA